jgi:hypothetical protein
MTFEAMPKRKKPILLLAASMIPGAGHVWLGQAPRGLMFIFFMTILGWISTKIMPETASFVGRHIGGIFIWGMSIIDVYRINRERNDE